MGTSRTTSVKVMFVCLGNICRSPTAQGIFQKMVDDAGMSEVIQVESSGTGSWHIGEGPDARAATAALQRGYDLRALRAQQVKPSDFEEFDYILAMDKQNLADLRRMCPEKYKGTLSLFLPYGSNSQYEEVPDPYYGGNQGFELVLDLVEDAARALLDEIKSIHQL